MSHRFAAILLAAAILVPEACAQTPPKPRNDSFGDPLPEGAIARFGTERLRPGRGTVAMAFSPDGALLASAHGDAVVDLWDTSTGRRHGRINSPTDLPINHIAFSPDRMFLAFGGWKWNSANQCHYYAAWLQNLANVSQPRLLVEKFGHVKGTPQLVFTSDGKTLLSVIDEFNPGGWWETVTSLWDVDTGLLKSTIEHPNTVKDLTLLKNGKQLATVGGDSELRTWDLDSGKLVQELKLAGEPTRVVRRSPDAEAVDVLIPQSDKRVIETWNLTKGWQESCVKEHWIFDPNLAGVNQNYPLLPALFEHLPHLAGVKQHLLKHGMEIYALAASADGKRVAAAISTRIFLWDAKTGKDLLPPSTQESYLGFVRILSDNNSVVTANSTGAISLWDTSNCNLVKQLSVDMGGAHYSPGICLANNTLVIQRPWSGKETESLGVDLWDVAAGKKLASWSIGPVRNLATDTHDAFAFMARPAISPDGKTLAVLSISEGGRQFGPRAYYKLRILDAATGKMQHEFGVCPGSAPLPQYSTDGKFLAINDEQQIEEDWADTVSGKPKLKRSGGQRLWDTLTWNEIAVPGFSTRLAMFLSPGGLPFGMPTASWHGYYGLASLDPAKKAWRKWLPQVPSYSFLAVLHDNNAALLRSGLQHDATLYIRDLATGKLLARLPGHQSVVTAADISLNGKYLATACSDGTALIWDVPSLLNRHRERSVPLPDDRLQALWTKLGTQPDHWLNEAVDDLVMAPNALAFLKRQLAPVSNADLAHCLDDLDSDNYGTRESAMAKLSRMEFAAKRALQDLLATQPALEVRRRVRILLADLGPDGGPRRNPMEEPNAAAHLKSYWRAIAALEQIATPEAVAVLQNLSKGVAEARLTQLAQAALRRLIAAKPG